MNVSSVAAGMLAQPAAGNATANSNQPSAAQILKLRKAATEFEGMLLSKWWSSMKEGGISGEEQSDPGHDTLDQLGMQALSSAVASSGGIGIGAMLFKSVLAKAEASGEQAAAAGPRSGQ